MLSAIELFKTLRSHKNRKTLDRLFQRLENDYTRVTTIVMVDSSGFTKRTQRYGVPRFLWSMTQGYAAIIPAIQKCRGTVVSQEADNLLAVFEGPSEAIEATLEIHRVLKRRNLTLPPEDRFNVCIGIDCGPVIRLRDNVYGNAVNVASKIGEDVADRDETLVTPAVRDRALGYRYRTASLVKFGHKRLQLYRVIPPVHRK